MRLPGSLRVLNEGLAFLLEAAVIVAPLLNPVLLTRDREVRLRLAAE